MKKTTVKNTVIVAILVALISIIAGLIFYINQPRQYLLEVYGVQFPAQAKITSLHNEAGWDGRLCYGTLRVQSNYHDGIVNTRNFTAISESRDSRIASLIQDVPELPI